MRLAAAFIITFASLTSAGAQTQPQAGMEHAQRAEAYARSFVAGFASDAMLHSVLRESTKSHSRLDWNEQRALDRRWRDEAADRTKGGLVEAITQNAVSDWLEERRAEAPGGAITEILVIDGLGWNVGQTAMTADFFQGDELQWQDILPNTEDAVIVSELEENADGSGRDLAVVSLPIVSGPVNIGVITLGVDMRKIP